MQQIKKFEYESGGDHEKDDPGYAVERERGKQPSCY